MNSGSAQQALPCRIIREQGIRDADRLIAHLDFNLGTVGDCNVRHIRTSQNANG